MAFSIVALIVSAAFAQDDISVLEPTGFPVVVDPVISSDLAPSTDDEPVFEDPLPTDGTLVDTNLGVNNTPTEGVILVNDVPVDGSPTETLVDDGLAVDGTLTDPLIDNTFGVTVSPTSTMSVNAVRVTDQDLLLTTSFMPNTVLPIDGTPTDDPMEPSDAPMVTTSKVTAATSPAPFELPPMNTKSVHLKNNDHDHDHDTEPKDKDYDYDDHGNMRGTDKGPDSALESILKTTMCMVLVATFW